MRYAQSLYEKLDMFYEYTHASVSYRIQNPHILTYQEVWYLCASVVSWAIEVVKEAGRILEALELSMVFYIVDKVQTCLEKLTAVQEELLTNPRVDWLNQKVYTAYTEGVEMKKYIQHIYKTYNINTPSGDA